MGGKYRYLGWLAAALFSVTALRGQDSGPTGELRTFDHGGTERTYRIHLPESGNGEAERMPLVICLHGGGGNAATMSRGGWTPLAERKRFCIVYPEGLNGHWNDGRNVRKHAEQNAVTDDVDFLIRLLDHLVEQHPIDAARVYVVGISNGGFMTQRLAIEHTERFAAIAVQIASLPTTYRDGPMKFSPSAPLPVLFMNGTEDPFMPYNGGKLTPNMAPRLIDSATFDFGQGSAIPTVDAAHLWVKHNQLPMAGKTTVELPDLAADGCTVRHHKWSGEDGTIAVEIYEIVGGGHTIPGGAQYLPERIIGKVCQDIDGVEKTWEFFEGKRRE